LRLLSQEKELNITRIVEKSGVNYKIVKKHLEFLVKIGFLQEKCFGRIKIYRFKQENQNVRALSNLIDLWES